LVGYWVTILGVLLVLEGMPWFLSPNRIRSLLAELSRLPDPVLRVMGFLAMAAGLFLVWIGRNWLPQ
jgi:uncharacterized protein YjeT (DUF2065 family)